MVAGIVIQFKITIDYYYHFLIIFCIDVLFVSANNMTPIKRVILL